MKKAVDVFNELKVPLDRCYIPVQMCASSQLFGEVIGQPTTFPEACNIVRVANVHGAVWSLYTGRLLPVRY